MSATVIISRDRDGSHWELESTLAGLCAATPGFSAIVIPHLYHLAAASPLWERLGAISGPVVLVAWLNPRPAEWILRARGIGSDNLVALPFEAYLSAEEIFESITRATSSMPSTSSTQSLIELSEPIAERWYPVLDVSLCRNCRNCLQFCLFGVYSLDEAGHVAATQPDRCKPGCPACSRICPEGAIIFPLYAKDAAIAGAPGTRMAPDAAARKMFYTRTRRTCPICGSTPEAPGTGEGSVCRECGRHIVKSDATPAIIRDDIDALLDDLDHLVQGDG